MKRSLVSLLAALSFSLPLAAQNETTSPCAGKDAARYVPGGTECLVYKAFGLETAGEAPLLAVFLHGDVSRGGPATYMYRYAEQYARPGIVGVALLRPGYYDAENNRSTGYDNGRYDTHTAPNIDAIAAAIGRLKDRFGAKGVFLLGHSGGAGVAGVILGRHPGLVNGAMLISCPCNLEQWYWDRRFSGVPRSLSPHEFVGKIPQETRVVVVSGEEDSVVYAEISKKYAQVLAKKGIKAEYRGIVGGRHGFATLARSPVFSEVLVLLLEDVARLGKE